MRWILFLALAATPLTAEEGVYQFDRSPSALVLDYSVTSTMIVPPEAYYHLQVFGDRRVVARTGAGKLARTFESTISEEDLQALLALLEENGVLGASKSSIDRRMGEVGHRGTLADGGVYRLQLHLEGIPGQPSRSVHQDLRMLNIPRWAEKYPEIEELTGLAACVEHLEAYLKSIAREGARGAR